MFALTTLLLTASLASGLFIPKHRQIASRFAELSDSPSLVAREDPPAGWLVDVLEDYDDYHIRYLALDCEAKHNTSFFAACCHPMLASEKLQTARPAECTPSASASASAAAAVASEEAEDDDDGDCDDSDDDTESTTVAATTTHATATTTHTSATSTHQATTTVKAAVKTTTTTAKATSSTSSASSSSQTFTDGFATFFYQNGVAGACGKVHSDNDLIAAIDQARYGNSGDVSSLCGKQVVITNPKNNKSVTVTIQDDCPTCKNEDSIDLSVAAFKQIATLDEGMVNIDWHFE